jgi:hypothetical protein
MNTESNYVLFQSTLMWNNYSVYYKNRLKNKFDLHLKLDYYRAGKLLSNPDYKVKVVYIHIYE